MKERREWQGAKQVGKGVKVEVQGAEGKKHGTKSKGES